MARIRCPRQSCRCLRNVSELLFALAKAAIPKKWKAYEMSVHTCAAGVSAVYRMGSLLNML